MTLAIPERTEAMSPEEIVRAEMAAWGRNDVDDVMSHFAEDAVFDTGPSYPVLAGRDTIRKTIEAYFSRGTCVDLEILYLAVDRDVVLMERDDHWIVNGKKMDTRVMGAYEVQDQKITAWREYFTPPANS
jgi:limonene-1,2-epoxide hydrolase